MNRALTPTPDPDPPISIRMQGGNTAPLRARRWVLSQLTGEMAESGTAELELIISELVTNSVRHADVGPDQCLTVGCARLPDALRVLVTDPGSRGEPHIRHLDRVGSGGYGLRLVESLCSAWGISRSPAGAMTVWCELPFATPPPHPAAPPGTAAA